MMKKTFTFGAAKPEELREFERLFREAYDNGEKRGGSMEWTDVQKALEKAIEAFWHPAAAMYQEFEANVGSDEEIEYEIVWASGSQTNMVESAAAKLILAYQNPEEVDWDDVDEAWEWLNTDPAQVPTP